jgi:hypothetical protein
MGDASGAPDGLRRTGEDARGAYLLRLHGVTAGRHARRFPSPSPTDGRNACRFFLIFEFFPTFCFACRFYDYICRAKANKM